MENDNNFKSRYEEELVNNRQRHEEKMDLASRRHEDEMDLARQRLELDTRRLDAATRENERKDAMMISIIEKIVGKGNLSN